MPPRTRPHEDSDIIVRTSGGTSFALKRLHLQANSEVFADMLEVANEAPRGVGLEHLPVVDITEKRQETALFLRHLVSTKYLVDSKPPSFLLPNGYVHGYLLDSVLVMCQKYQTPSVRSVVIQIHLPKLMKTLPPFAFGLAVVHGELDWARICMRTCSQNHTEEKGCIRWSSKRKTILHDQRDVCLSDIDPLLLARFPLSAIISFSQVHAKVGTSYTWEQAADEFKLCSTRRTPRLRSQPSSAYPPLLALQKIPIQLNMALLDSTIHHLFPSSVI
ncbi:hypothetical protein BDY24DRAFT_417052 [Mrakia frigida]|uniref:uncharacterized protein n=1 Tax=Mrakia frigida TaxID=29902 RepID=UPI003FCC2144